MSDQVRKLTRSSDGATSSPSRQLPDRINLGCGPDYRDGWHNVDIRPEIGPDEVVDLDGTPWPWPDNSFETTIAINVIEHLDDQHAALHELARITRPGGTIRLAFPHPAGRSQWIDPTHANTLHIETFQHALAPEWELVDWSASTVRFGRVLPDRAALWWADHLGFLIDELRVELQIPEENQ